jgi:hypothetical protein
LIGSKFIVDPSLCITVNNGPVELMSLEGLKTTDITVNGYGKITVHFIDSIEHYRSARLRGITWWVNQRRVGEPSWDRLDDEGAYLDGGVKANVLFLDAKPAQENPWTKTLWVYDLRTNMHFTQKTNSLQRSDLDEFVSL